MTTGTRRGRQAVRSAADTDPIEAVPVSSDDHAQRSGARGSGLALLLDPRVRRAQLAAAGCVAFLIFVRDLYPAPAPILLQGAILGSLSAMIAMGLVLVYRAMRIINFAQGELGAVAGLLGVLLVARFGWPYLAVIAAGLVAAVLLGAVVEFLFVRRFAAAPRLILMVATIGIAQVLAGFELALPSAFGNDVAPQNLPTPFHFAFTWSPVIFRGGHLLAVIMVVLTCVGLNAFFRYTRVGMAIRASAESSERAAQLGIPVKRLGTIVWMLAAGLSALASLLSGPIVGVAIGTVLGPALLLRALAAAVIGRMENLPVTFGAAVVLGMMEQAVVWHTGRAVITDVVLLVVILGALLFQRRSRASRVEEGQTSTWSLIREVRPVPPELRPLSEVRGAKFGLGLAAVLALTMVPAFLNPSRVNLIGVGLIMAMLGASLVVLTGWAGQISLGQVALFGFGAAIASRLADANWNFLLAVTAAGLVGAAISAAIGVPGLRVKGLFLPVVTLAFALAASSFFFNREFFGWLIVTGRVTRPILFGKFDLESERAFYYVILILFALVMAALTSLRRSRAGRVLVMVRDNPRAAQGFGVNLFRARLTAFAVAGFFAALAGALYVFHQRAFDPNEFVPEESLRIFALVVFGGLGSLPGVVLSAAYFTALDFFVPLQQFRFFASGAGLLLVLLIVPGGLGQLLYDGRDALLRRLAARKKIIVPSLSADHLTSHAPPVHAMPLSNHERRVIDEELTESSP